MNIGLVVNARGALCLVHDEPFDATPLWVGYHLDRRMIEIMFDNGATFPIEWEATDEIDLYLVHVTKILLIRMEDRRPVEGYDTSLLKMRCGKAINHRVAAVVGDHWRGDDLGGLLRLQIRATVGDARPDALVYAPLRHELRLTLPGGRSLALPLQSRFFHGALLRHAAAFVEYGAPDDGGQSRDWLPIRLSLDPPDDVEPMREADPAPRVMAGCIAWDAGAGVATLALPDAAGELLLDRTELARTGRSAITPGENVACAPGMTGFGILAALDPGFVETRFEPPPALPPRKADPGLAWTWNELSRAASPDQIRTLSDHFARSGLALPAGRSPADMRVGELPFYDDGMAVSISDTDPSRHWTYFWSPRRLTVVPAGADGNNLMRANLIFGFNADGENARGYLLFVLNCCDKARLAPFTLVERPEQIPWSQAATSDHRRQVSEFLAPLTCEGGNDDFAGLAGTVLFRTCLFSARILVARRSGRYAALPGRVARDYNAGDLEVVETRLLVRGIELAG